MASWLKPKIAGYAGFQSYGVKPYASKKPGDADIHDYLKTTRRLEDQLKFYDNFRRTDNSVYRTDISENTVPEDYRDLKIIKKGQGQKDLKSFLTAFESGTNDFRVQKPQNGLNATSSTLSSQVGQLQTDDKAGQLDGLNIDINQLKSSVAYHKKFLDNNSQLVQLKNYSGLQQAAEQYNGGHPFFEQSSNPAAQQQSLSPPHLSTSSNHELGQSIQEKMFLSLIPENDQQGVIKELKLPENLVPVWKVDNNLYEIYYIPGYDNWMYNRVKKNPRSLLKLSNYKQKFFETMTEETQVQKQNIRPELVESVLQVDPDLHSQFSKTHSLNFPKTAAVNQHYRNDLAQKEVQGNQSRGIRIRNSNFGSTLKQQATVLKSGVVLPQMRANSTNVINNYKTVDLGHTQYNQTGFYPSGRENTSKTGWIEGPDDKKLRSGTEFWQTSYQASVINPWKDCRRQPINPMLNPEKMPGDKGNKKGCEGDCECQGDEDCIENLNPELDKKMKSTLAGRSQSLNQRPPHRMTQCRTQVTEYNFSYGKLGTNPRQIMPLDSNWKPFVNDPLKFGTTQLTSHIPNYTGFLPATDIRIGQAIKHGIGRVPRTTFVKENITDNFDNYIPGYAGFKPKNERNKPTNVRASIFGSRVQP